MAEGATIIIRRKLMKVCEKPKTVKKNYCPPALIFLGSIHDLTQGTTGSPPENGPTTGHPGSRP